LVMAFVIASVAYFTEGGTLQHSIGFSIALSGHRDPADDGFNITGFPPAVTEEG
jgi:hypothetical protein